MRSILKEIRLHNNWLIIRFIIKKVIPPSTVHQMVPGIRIVYSQRVRHGSKITELLIIIVDFLVDPLVVILLLSGLIKDD